MTNDTEKRLREIDEFVYSPDGKFGICKDDATFLLDHIKELQVELKDAWDKSDAMSERDKWPACACSYDNKYDVCLTHSPITEKHQATIQSLTEEVGKYKKLCATYDERECKCCKIAWPYPMVLSEINPLCPHCLKAQLQEAVRVMETIEEKFGKPVDSFERFILTEIKSFLSKMRGEKTALGTVK